jgi:hypothetical protein
MLSEVFWVAFITTITGMVIKLCSMAYKSKCKVIDCCCIKIIRDTDAEEKEEEFRVLHQPINQQPSTNNLNNSV